MTHPPLSHPFLSRFSSELEQQFQHDYYARVRATMRLVSPLMVALILVHLTIDVRIPRPYDLAVNVPQLCFWSLLFGLTWVKSFERIWQPFVVLSGWLAAFLALGQLAPLLTQELQQGAIAGAEVFTVPQQKFYFVMQFAVLVVSLATLRLQSRWAALLYGGVSAIASWAFLSRLPPAPDIFLDVRFVFLPVLLIVFVLLLVACIEEQLARRAFVANHQLEEERDNEKRRREQTEGKLHILAQAIGGIVHDLGNPLTTVQMGTSTLDTFIDSDADKKTLKEFTGMIGDGAQMLNFLRLSLIEQVRVLEGKPTPVETRPVSVRVIVEAGARFQKPHALAGRVVQVVCDDARIEVDEMKMVTVFMNLIGNALKYSDGEVQVEWRESDNAGADGEKKLAIAVLDCGTGGKGLTTEQAARLFTAFGRLETHSQIEGTGLGLLSVQKIAQAHGGEAFIEGYADGTPDSSLFSTSQDSYPSMLHDQYRTAFVVTCPLAPQE